MATVGKILITPRSFAKTDDTPKRLLMEAGYELICNPAGSILTREQMQELIEDADGVIIGVDPLDREIISAGRRGSGAYRSLSRRARTAMQLRIMPLR